MSADSKSSVKLTRTSLPEYQRKDSKFSSLAVKNNFMSLLNDLKVQSLETFLYLIR